jgi:hypothetical protein
MGIIKSDFTNENAPQTLGLQGAQTFTNADKKLNLFET